MSKVSKYLLALIVAVVIGMPVYAQEGESTETSIATINDRLAGIDENMAGLQTDVSGLKKFKFSGYFQFEFNKTEERGKGFGYSPYDSSTILNQFRIRRGRVKLTYDGGLSSVVFQGDFTNKGFTIKDFYMDITDPWVKMVKLRAGYFNRPNYEVEYSSSQRESMERSNVIRALYPGERDMGAMFTISPEDMFELQLAGFMNTYQGSEKQFIPSFKDEPLYYMARLTKSFSFNDLGLGVDLGAHARIGSMPSNSPYVIESDAAVVDSSNKIAKGDGIDRTWFGFETQIYWDFLGGMKLMGEYIMGSNADEPKLVAKTANAPAIRKRDFMGYYVMLVKNITDDFQFAAKYDSYDPNTAIDDKLIQSTSDLSKSTLGIGLHNYSFPNVRISLWYDMNTTETSDNLVKGKKLLAKDPIDNLLTLRLQYKF